jgi:hypothetical protein
MFQTFVKESGRIIREFLIGKEIVIAGYCLGEHK